MTDLLKTKESFVWFVLIVITLGSWVLGANHGILFTSGAGEAATLMVLAYFKVRLVILYFMEVRHASVLLKASFESWLIISCLITLCLCFGIGF